MLAATDFTHFLLCAKRATHAAQGTQASVPPLPSDSKQLEYRDRDFLYRDLYVDMLQFVGQAIAYASERAVWPKSYAGGLYPGVGIANAGSVYGFLREALRNVPAELPLRDPQSLQRDLMRYTCQCTGSVEQFHGTEIITENDACLYQLQFSGGMLA